MIQHETGLEPPLELQAVSETVQALMQRGNVTWEELEQLQLNSFERDRVLPYLTTEALCNLAAQVKQRCAQQRHYPPLTYDEALVHRITPLLIERLRHHNDFAAPPLESREVTL